MTFKEAGLAIEKWTVRAIKPGLTRTKQLLLLSGYPDRFFSSIQIAGTNGKGSTTAMLASILTFAGYRTGRFTSPHIMNECERISINNQPISKKQFVNGVIKLIPGLKIMMKKATPVTTFEAWTVLAAIIFKESKVELAVIEVGLGGRFDATTAFSKKILTCITNIQLDHTALLGETKSAICFEKMGIVKTGVPLLSSELEGKIRKQMSQLARERQVPLYFCGTNKQDQLVIKEDKVKKKGLEVTLAEGSIIEKYQTSLNGSFQRYNLTLAVMAVKWLNVLGWNITQYAIKKGLLEVSWPGRLEKIHQKPTIYLDGGHNPAAFNAVIHAINPKPKELIVVMAMMKDKAVEECIEILCPWIKKAYVFNPEDKDRGLGGVYLKKMFEKKGIYVDNGKNIKEIIKKIIKKEKNNEKILIIGSLYNIKAAKSLFKNK